VILALWELVDISRSRRRSSWPIYSESNGKAVLYWIDAKNTLPSRQGCGRTVLFFFFLVAELIRRRVNRDDGRVVETTGRASGLGHGDLGN
jgi:hypothetical protein